MHSYRSILRYLYSLQQRGMKFGLRNSRTLLRALDDPHRKFPSIHIAGTNGKGSTSAFLSSILQEAGFRTGLYTSPHLLRFTERIRINGREMPTRRLVEYVEELRPVIERVHATFFEATTAVAFRYFADEGVDIAVVETGLGGRLDSTNVLRPLVSVITSIALDHTQILGNTIALIAAEKGGIIKRGRPVVSSVRGRDAERVLQRIARQRHAPFVPAASIVRATEHGDVLRFRKGRLKGKNVVPGLVGEHQKRNVEAAVATISVLQKTRLLREVSDEDVLRGVERVRTNTGLRGRYETVETPRGRLIFDVAHNPDGIKALVAMVRARKDRPAVVVFGVMADKNFRGILRQLRKVSRRLVAVAPHGERALGIEELTREARKSGFRVESAASVAAGVEAARRLAGARTILITGSHYVVAEAMAAL
ncbi:MAG TPA: folylpolyglutamate synthase/dihydrofolate synthase family protein [Bacteroidota bacterium]|nr:folylpolyglutamate synthase/dihydrofolate synthase family protein [Bacteroidota bacterium]